LSVTPVASRFFIDGPWCPGGSNALQPAFLPKMGGGQILTAETGAKVLTYRGLPDPTFFVSGSSKDPRTPRRSSSRSFTTDEYQKLMTEAMDQPPLDLDVVDTANVIEPYKKVINLFKAQVFQAPEAIVRNPDIAAVDAQRKPSPRTSARSSRATSGAISPIFAVP
jgi:hypothetical protein